MVVCSIQKWCCLDYSARQSREIWGLRKEPKFSSLLSWVQSSCQQFDFHVDPISHLSRLQWSCRWLKQHLSHWLDRVMTTGKHDLPSDLVQLVLLRLESVPWHPAEDAFSPVQQLFSLLSAMAPLGSGLTGQELDCPGSSCFVKLHLHPKCPFQFWQPPLHLPWWSAAWRDLSELCGRAVRYTGVRHTRWSTS